MTVIASTTLVEPIITTAKICLDSNFLNSPNLKAAQTFQVSEGAWDITSVEVYLCVLKDDDVQAGTITVRLREDSPTGTILGTQTLDRTTLQVFSSWDYETFNFSGFTLSSGNIYCVTVECPVGHYNSGLDWDCILWPRASSYASGVGYAYSDPAGWVIQAYDWVIRVNGTEVELPEKATNPAPANTSTSVKLSLASTSWVDGGAGQANAADTYNVYYGDAPGSLSLVSSAQAGTSFAVAGITLGSPYGYLTSRYWRIDSTNSAGTTTGDAWGFRTIRFRPPFPPEWYPDGPWWWIPLPPYDDPPVGPPDGVEGDDYEIVTFGPNFIRTVRKLVVAVGHSIWVEDL